MVVVVNPASGNVTVTFAAVAKHYGAAIAVCPPRRGCRRGVVEKANHAAAPRRRRSAVSIGPCVPPPRRGRAATGRSHPPVGKTQHLNQTATIKPTKGFNHKLRSG
jgi:hypothetical protein